MNHTKAIKLGMLVTTLFLASSLSIPSYAEENLHRHEWSAENRAEHFQKHLDELHSKLNLNSAQETAWQTYTHKIAPTNQDQRGDWEAISKLPAPERLDKMIAIKSEHLQRLEAHAAALKEFYATLGPEQKTIFDLATQRPWKGGSKDKEHQREHKRN